MCRLLPPPPHPIAPYAPYTLPSITQNPSSSSSAATGGSGENKGMKGKVLQLLSAADKTKAGAFIRDGADERAASAFARKSKPIVLVSSAAGEVAVTYWLHCRRSNSSRVSESVAWLHFSWTSRQACLAQPLLVPYWKKYLCYHIVQRLQDPIRGELSDAPKKRRQQCVVASDWKYKQVVGSLKCELSLWSNLSFAQMQKKKK